MLKTFLFTFSATCAFAQVETLLKDLDKDGIKDSVYVHQKNGKVVCKLSSQNFKKIQSKSALGDMETGVRATKSGFEFYDNAMRAGSSLQFRYDEKAKKIQLIGMSRYEFGNAANDGSGESSVNLLTNNYIGKWNYYDRKKEKLIPIPPIKTKMVFGTIFLENYDDTEYGLYMDKCSNLYHKTRKKFQQKKL